MRSPWGRTHIVAVNDESSQLHNLESGSTTGNTPPQGILPGQPLDEFLQQLTGRGCSGGLQDTPISFSSLRSAQPITLEWDFSVGAGRKQILSRSIGRSKPGEVCCVLGPSGAGKSTLLNVLAGRQLNTQRVRVEGQLNVNGQPMDPWRLRPKVAYVMQKDEFFATETPREALTFSARLRLQAARLANLEEKGQLQERLSELLTSLGLQSCCDRPIGGPSVNGISNGERKRVSIGVELITQPSIVFLDEPTTGLDSFSAWQVMRIVKALANSGCTVICTMHQPSSEIFALIDRVICLCDGRAIFQGKATDLPRWLETCGYQCPPEHNPADYVMFLMETERKNHIESLAECGSMSAEGSFRSSPTGRTNGLAKLNPASLRKSFGLQLWCLTQREWRNLWRDSASLQLRFFLTVTLSLLFSVVFVGIGEHPVLDDLLHCTGPPNSWYLRGPFWNRVRRFCVRLRHPEVNSLQLQLQTELEYHYKAVVQVGFVAMFSACQPTILSFPLERPVFLREFSANMYGTVAYFFSKMLVEVPLGGAQALLALLISHRLMQLQGDFWEMWFTICLLNMCSVSFSLLIGCLVRFPRESGAIGPLVFVPQLMMSGTFIPVKAIPAYLRWMQYFCFLQYAVKLLAVVEFRRTDPAVRRLIFRTMEVNPDLTGVYVTLLIILSIVFSWSAIFLLSKKAHSIY